MNLASTPDNKNGLPSNRTAFVDGIHGLRAIAAIAVVFFHSGGAIGADKYQSLTSVSDLTKGLNSGVDLFFVISGFVIALPFFLGRKTSIPNYVKNRLLRIYPISVLTACIFIGSAWLVYGRVPSADVLLSSIFLLPNGTDPIPIVLWTLKQELLFYALFAIVYFRPVIGFLIIGFWGAASSLLSQDAAFVEWFFNSHNVQFPLGVLAAYIFVNHPLPKTTARLLAVCSMISFIAASYGHKAYDIEGGMAAILLGVLAGCVVLGTACAGMEVPRAVMFLGTASYSIYLERVAVNWPHILLL